jgi:hypothetical protein
MARQEYKVSELVGMISRGELKLPEMQRQYVWRATRVRDLLDSLYRGYPSGVILAWQTDEAVDTRDFAVETLGKGVKGGMLLLDGQQRLTSLSAILSGQPVSVRGRKKPIEILFNLEHPDGLRAVTEVNEDDDSEDLDEDEDHSSELEEDEADSPSVLSNLESKVFVVYSKVLDNRDNWVSVSDVFKYDNFEIFERKGLDFKENSDKTKEYFKKLDKVRSIADYVYRVDLLEKTMSYEEVTEIFVRVNSLGAKLRGSDLALAQVTSRWRNSLQLFLDYQLELDKTGMNIEVGLILKCLVSHATNQSKFATVASISQEDLSGAWLKTQKSLAFAVNFSAKVLGISSNQLLASPFLLITIAYWIDNRNYNVSDIESDGMRKWALLANAKGRYSRGSSEDLLNQDLAVIRDGGGFQQLLDRLRQQVGRLEIEESDLVARNARSGLFKTMFLVFQRDNAKDWVSKLPISPNHMGKSNKLQFHHIFPKKYLLDTNPHLRKSEVDDIANLAFISGPTNVKISATAPNKYLPEIVKAGEGSILESQCVPLASELWEPGKYEEFLSERRRLISLKMNEFIFQAK